MKLAWTLRLLAIRRRQPPIRYYPEAIENHLRDLGLSPWPAEELQR